jgi:hypothetical protein
MRTNFKANNREDEQFLFIVGMPRSGTKLLRDLINRHSRISIPDVETLFYPHFIQKFGLEFPRGEKRQEILQVFYNMPFWDFNRDREVNISAFEEGFSECTSWADFYRLIAFYFGPDKEGSDGKLIFGDKSPNYIYHIKLLNDVVRNAKFIHIVRDPRDYCLSMRKTWNKNIFRAAHRWKQGMQSTKEFQGADNYLEVKYEQLTSETHEVIERICEFIGVTYEPTMVTLSKPSENYGDAKGMSKVVSSNSEKFKSLMTEKEISRIEELTLPEIANKEYKALFAKKDREALKINIVYWRILDIFNLIKFNIGEFGWRKGLGHFKKYVNLH